MFHSPTKVARPWSRTVMLMGIWGFGALRLCGLEVTRKDRSARLGVPNAVTLSSKSALPNDPKVAVKKGRVPHASRGTSRSEAIVQHLRHWVHSPLWFKPRCTANSPFPLLSSAYSPRSRCVDSCLNLGTSKPPTLTLQIHRQRQLAHQQTRRQLSSTSVRAAAAVAAAVGL